MKKFLFGFILGAIFFGSIGVAAVKEDTIKIKWDINDIYVDGKLVNMKKSNPAFTYNGVAYIPSYVLSDLDYSPSRSANGQNIILNAKGRQYIPSSAVRTPGESETSDKDNNVNRIFPSSDVTTGAKLTFNVNASEPLTEGNKSYEHFIHVKFQEKSSSVNAKSTFSFQLNEDFRRFSTKFSYITSSDSPRNLEPVTLTVYLTNSSDKVTIYKTYKLSSIQKSIDIDIPLRGYKAIEFDISNTSLKEQEVVMLNPVLVK